MKLDIQGMLDSLPAHLLADIVASVVKTSYVEKLDILNSISLKERSGLSSFLIHNHINQVRKGISSAGETTGRTP